MDAEEVVRGVIVVGGEHDSYPDSRDPRGHLLEPPAGEYVAFLDRLQYLQGEKHCLHGIDSLNVMSRPPGG